MNILYAKIFSIYALLSAFPCAQRSPHFFHNHRRTWHRLLLGKSVGNGYLQYHQEKVKNILSQASTFVWMCSRAASPGQRALFKDAFHLLSFSCKFSWPWDLSSSSSNWCSFQNHLYGHSVMQRWGEKSPQSSCACIRWIYILWFLVRLIFVKHPGVFANMKVLVVWFACLHLQEE